MEFGEAIKQARIAAHITQRELAAAAGITRLYINLLEAGKRRPSKELFNLLFSILKKQPPQNLATPTRHQPQRQPRQNENNYGICLNPSCIGRSYNGALPQHAAGDSIQDKHCFYCGAPLTFRHSCGHKLTSRSIIFCPGCGQRVFYTVNECQISKLTLAFYEDNAGQVTIEKTQIESGEVTYSLNREQSTAIEIYNLFLNKSGITPGNPYFDIIIDASSGISINRDMAAFRASKKHFNDNLRNLAISISLNNTTEQSQSNDTKIEIIKRLNSTATPEYLINNSPITPQEIETLLLENHINPGTPVFEALLWEHTAATTLPTETDDAPKTEESDPITTKAVTVPHRTNYDVFNKCNNFTIARQLMESGIYPYFKELESEQAPEVTIRGKRFIMLGSNNYLGLANDPRMKQASIDAVRKFGTGVAGSRFLNGNTALHTELERKLAAFEGRDTSLIYATGYQMNLGVVSALVGKGDYAVVDKLNHASILDGCRLSHGEIRRFKHNDPADLDKVLKDIGPRHGKLVIVDGIFSMEGDIAPVPDIASVCKKHGARLMVDDAHAIGVLGKHGQGTMEYFGLNNKDVDLVAGTCSKALASMGGFVAGDEQIIHYIQHVSRSMIFSAALPPAAVASSSKAIDIIKDEPQRIEKLWRNSYYLMARLKALGLNIGNTKTPIIPVIIGDDVKTFMLWRLFYSNGLFTNPVVSPEVPPKRALIRIVPIATHTKEQLDHAADIIKKCISELSTKQCNKLAETPIFTNNANPLE